MAEVIAQLQLLEPGLPLEVTSRAPASLFPSKIAYRHAAIDSPIFESGDTLQILGERCGRAAEEFFRGSEAVIQEECSYLVSRKVTCVVADIPPLAGPIAAAAGVPCIGISNFTWNWILEPWLDPDTLQRMEQAYSTMSSYWQLPFAHQERINMFPEVIATPLIAPCSVLSREQARKQLGLESESRPIVLIALRGDSLDELLQRAEQASKQFRFLTYQPGRGGDFHDHLSASDIVVGKLGYGLAAECVTKKKRLLYPKRSGFREDAITSVEALRYTAMAELPREDFVSGHWTTAIEALLDVPMPDETIPSNGASVCAERIVVQLS